jgi:hypothetical protein
MLQTEPRNPFYMLLLLAGLVFVVTALGYAVLPIVEQKATEAGSPPPPATGFRKALKQDGWKWLLYQVAAIAVLSLLSMGLDRLRSLQKERAASTIPPNEEERPPATESLRE